MNSGVKKVLTLNNRNQWMH